MTWDLAKSMNVQLRRQSNIYRVELLLYQVTGLMISVVPPLSNLFPRFFQVFRSKAKGKEFSKRSFPNPSLTYPWWRFLVLIYGLRIVAWNEEDRHIQFTKFTDDLAADTARGKRGRYIS